MLLSLNMVHFHYTQNLRTREELQSWNFVFQTIVFDDFQGPSDFHDHTLGICVKRNLTRPLGD